MKILSVVILLVAVLDTCTGMSVSSIVYFATFCYAITSCSIVLLCISTRPTGQIMKHENKPSTLRRKFSSFVDIFKAL